MKIILGFTLALLSLGASAQSRLGRQLGGNPLQQLAELTGAQGGAGFGNNVAISGDTVVVGIPLSSEVCGDCGAAYVYSAVGGDWTNLVQTATLTASSPSSFSGFGEPVAISGDTVVVAGNNQVGQPVVYVYVNPSGNVTETAQLTVSGSQAAPIFGLGIDGNFVVAGMPQVSVGRNVYQGSAYIYVEPAGGWADMTQTAQLLATDGASNAIFGITAGISGRNVVIGATQAEFGGVEEGLAYLYVEPVAGWGGIWGQTTEFVASNATRNAGFGASVSVSGDTVAIGAPAQTVGANALQGAAYVFARPSTGWPKTMTQSAELTAEHGTPGNGLGDSVVISGKTVVAGAPSWDGGLGTALVFFEPSGGWQNASSAEQITASDGAADNNFGRWLAIGNNALAVSSPGWPAGGIDPDGAVYIFGTGQ